MNRRRNSAWPDRIARQSREFRNRTRKGGGVNRAYANVVEALRASGTCRTRLILNTCFLVLAGSTPTRREWSLYGIVLSLSLPLLPFASISLERCDCETSRGLYRFLPNVLHLSDPGTIGFWDIEHRCLDERDASLSSCLSSPINGFPTSRVIHG